MDRSASSRGRLTERGYHAENISGHHRAHDGSDIFCRFHHLAGCGLTDPGEEKEQLEKISCEKAAGVRGSQKDRRVAETGPEEKNVWIDQIIARPA